MILLLDLMTVKVRGSPNYDELLANPSLIEFLLFALIEFLLSPLPLLLLFLLSAIIFS
jgi:hypothetical protein